MNSTKKEDNISSLAQIRKSCCTKCGLDLTQVIQAIKSGKIDRPPERCPQCQSKFLKVGTKIGTERFYYCGRCKTEIPDGGPKENVYCRKCGAVLIWAGQKA